ncbi:hypothetical protein V1525DRAFT_403512 [Lipomyces kononenkoae]|uniref:Uncharacterized protein n=1 Tax=Lipomyces kononenkoae TaxID=34357 RepID=A0ACC3T119_LIPKO
MSDSADTTPSVPESAMHGTGQPVAKAPKLRASPQFSRRISTPPLNEQIARQSRYSYVTSSPNASPNDASWAGGPAASTPSLKSPSLRPAVGRAPTSAGVYHASSSAAPVSTSSPSLKHVPGRYQQQQQTPLAPSVSAAAARSYLQNRQSTATTISTLSGGGGVYSQSPTQTTFPDTQLAKRSYGSYFPPYFSQSDLVTQAEQLSGTTPLPKARPIVDTHDAMWADLDIMQDIEEAADQVDKEGNFFGEVHVKGLENLQQAQIELAMTMEKGEDVIDLVSDQGKLWEVNDKDIALAKSSKIFNEDHFDHVQQIVDTAMAKLDNVVDSMKILEGQSRDLWNEKSYEV